VKNQPKLGQKVEFFWAVFAAVADALLSTVLFRRYAAKLLNEVPKYQKVFSAVRRRRGRKAGLV
jgi:hypothetical protein